MPTVKLRSLGVFLASADKAEYAALHLVIEQQREVCIVGDASDTHGVLDHIFDCGADLLLLDWELPVRSELLAYSGGRSPKLAVPDLIATLRSEMGHIHIIVLTLDPDMEAAALAVGADIVVCKTGPPQKMLAALITAISAQQVELSA